MNDNSWHRRPIEDIVREHDAPEIARFGARVLVLFFMLIVLMLVLVPWQQTSQGQGKVIAFSPDKRVQGINAPFAGRIRKWHVFEGQTVKKDQLILEMMDVDPFLLDRLKVERDASLSQYEAAKQVTKTSNYNFERQKELFERGISSRKDYEDAIIAFRTAQSGEAGALATLTQAESRLARQAHQEVRAPGDGQVIHLKSGVGTVQLAEGDVLAEFVPEGQDLAVEIRIPGMDLPLVRPGARVRLQFEGWPAIQFSGWPSVAVGTFGGKVMLVDPSANANGEFRVIVVPDSKGWPAARFIRQGTRANAWVLLNNVPLGFELWRQFNGFPPTMTAEDGGGP